MIRRKLNFYTLRNFLGFFLNISNSIFQNLNSLVSFSKLKEIHCNKRHYFQSNVTTTISFLFFFLFFLYIMLFILTNQLKITEFTYIYVHTNIYVYEYCIISYILKIIEMKEEVNLTLLLFFVQVYDHRMERNSCNKVESIYKNTCFSWW